jgi:hypothetical protein
MTRANVVVWRNQEGKPAWMQDYMQILYRHSDGYPACTGSTLRSVIDEVGNQAANFKDISVSFVTKMIRRASGYFEMSDDIHGDIEWLYVIELKDDCIELKCFHCPLDFHRKPWRTLEELESICEQREF